MPRSLNLPHPSEVTDATGVVYRTREDVIEIYNQETGRSAKALSGSVREWVNDKAASDGWGDVKWPLAYPSKTKRAGAVFVKGVIIALAQDT